MIREEAIVKTLKIHNIGQHEYFQLSLPKDTRRLIGLEFGTTSIAIPEFLPEVFFLPILDSFKMVKNRVKGKLTLQVPGRENMFYQGDIMEDRNIGMGETIASNLWAPEKWIHGRKREEICFSVPKQSNLVEGIYRDLTIPETGLDPYIVRIFLWIEKNIP